MCSEIFYLIFSCFSSRTFDMKFRGVFRGGGYGAKPPLRPVKSIDFKGFSGPNGFWAPGKKKILSPPPWIRPYYESTDWLTNYLIKVKQISKRINSTSTYFKFHGWAIEKQEKPNKQKERIKEIRRLLVSVINIIYINVCTAFTLYSHSPYWGSNLS